MKKSSRPQNPFLYLIFFIFFFVFQAQAKTTYIPTYNNRITLIEDGKIDSTTNKARILTMRSKDGIISCNLEQQLVSEQLVHSIKNAKNNAGWAMVAAALSSVSQGISKSQINYGYDKGEAVQNYLNARDNTYASISAYSDATKQADGLTTLLLDLVVKNDSRKEMLITDMDRGFVWFVLPNCEARISLLRGEDCHFRISSCNPLDENVKYINVRGTNTLKKYTVALETDNYWYLPVSKKFAKDFYTSIDEDNGYFQINKETMNVIQINSDEFKKIKKEIK